MRRILKSTPKNLEFINSLPKMYLLGFWARYGKMEFPFSGKYENDRYGNMVPLVYDYDDFNGTCEGLYILKPITYTTTGQILCWSQCKYSIEELAEAMNLLNNRDEIAQRAAVRAIKEGFYYIPEECNYIMRVEPTTAIMVVGYSGETYLRWEKNHGKNMVPVSRYGTMWALDEKDLMSLLKYGDWVKDEG